MTPGEGRVLACLYARSDRVPKACSNAQATLKQQNDRLRSRFPLQVDADP